MKGLFIQDLIIFKKQTLLWIVLMGLTFLYTILEMPDFMIAFGTLYLAMFAIKTINLELSPQTGSFFFTLPFTNSQFVLEKYLITVCIPLLFSLVLSFLTVALGQLSLKEGLFASGISICSVLLLSIIMIPLTIRFHDKAVFISMALMAGFFLGIVLVQDYANALTFLKDYLLWFEIGIPIGLFLLLILSIFLSLKWLKAKEF